MTQSKINFKGTAAIPSITKTNTEEQDSNIVNDPKRQRTDHEDIEDGELRDELLLIPTAGSEMSLFNADSIDTIVNGLPRESLPAHRTNNDHFLTAEEIDVKAIKLERLRDKSDRYSSHIEFLKDCRDTQVIPKGLRIDILPTIGNNDDAFCAKWFDTLQGVSITLMNQIIEYSEKI